MSSVRVTRAVYMIGFEYLYLKWYAFTRVFYKMAHYDTFAGFCHHMGNKPLKRVDIPLSVIIGLYVILSPLLP